MARHTEGIISLDRDVCHHMSRSDAKALCISLFVGPCQAQDELLP